MATISGILNNLRKANQRIENNTTEIKNIKQDYVAKDVNATPVTESVAWEVTNTGALQSTETKRNVATGETSTVTQTPIPVVDTAARLIQPAEIQKINQLNQWYEINNNGNALNYAVDLTDIPNNGNANEAAVQTYLTAKFNAAGNTTGNPTQDLVTLVDNDTGAKYVWYVNSAAWVQSNSATGAQATNEIHDPVTNAVTQLGTKGVIMGSDAKGKLFVEVDGTASLVGYDEMTTNIANNAAAAAAKYTKPSTGIPSDDMTDEVKASLQKADTALQSVPDATDTDKGVAKLGVSGGAARYGEKADVGLGNVDNTSDTDKPISTAMQTALNAKQDKLSETQLANIAAVPNKANIVKATEAELKTSDAVYADGTLIWNTTRKVLKVGDGVTNYKKLNFVTTEEDKKYAKEQIYGVTGVGQSSPTLTRTDDAVGLSYEVGTNTVTSGFDNCYPWCDMKRVTDGQGNVFIQIPKFYAKRTSNGDGTEKWQISGTRYDGFTTLFVDGKGNEIDYVRVGAYEGSGSSSHVYSKSGQSVLVNITMDSFRTGCAANGAGYQQYDFLIDWIIKFLFTIEFATTNSQAIMYGFANSSNSAAQTTGQTDTVSTPSGSKTSNSDGYSSCKYRGIENPWGNTWTFVDGISFSGSNVYVSEDPTGYQAGKTSAPYQLMGTRPTSSSVYLKAINSFDNNPLLGYASNVSGGSESTYFCDYYYYNSSGTILLVGGAWDDAARAGLWCWAGYYTASTSNSRLGGRLCYKPL